MKIPATVAARLQELRERQFLVIQSNGPTSHVLSTPDGSEKVRVSFGSPSNCSCGASKNDDIPCIHMLFLLIRMFRVSESSPVLSTTFFSERQIEDILSGRCGEPRSRSPHSSRQFLRKSNGSTSVDGSHKVKMRSPKEVETCMVCLDSIMNAEYSTLTFCRAQCGTPVHIACMRVWCDHRRSLHENITCPMCRAPWVSLDPPKLKKPADVVPKLQSNSADETSARHFGDVEFHMPLSSSSQESLHRRSTSVGNGSQRVVKGCSFGISRRAVQSVDDDVVDLVVDTRSKLSSTDLFQEDSQLRSSSRLGTRLKGTRRSSSPNASPVSPKDVTNCISSVSLFQNRETNFKRDGSSRGGGKLILGRTFGTTRSNGVA